MLEKMIDAVLWFFEGWGADSMPAADPHHRDTTPKEASK